VVEIDVCKQSSIRFSLYKGGNFLFTESTAQRYLYQMHPLLKSKVHVWNIGEVDSRSYQELFSGCGFSKVLPHFLKTYPSLI